MKKSFLLLLLMTLLPLASWAQTLKFTSGDTYAEANEVETLTLGNQPNVWLIWEAEYPDGPVNVTDDVDWLLFDDVDGWYEVDEFEAGVEYKVVYGAWDDPTAYDYFLFHESGDDQQGDDDDDDDDDATLVEVQVTPVSGLSFEYQTPLDEIVVRPDMVSITVNPVGVNPFLTPEGRAEVAEKLKIDNAKELSEAQVGEKQYRFAIADPEDETIEKGDITYIIKPILYGIINIVAGQNELINYGSPNDENPTFGFDVITGIPYDGQKHDLVEGNYYTFTTWSAETGGWQYAHGTAQFVEYVDDADDQGTHVAIVQVLTNTADGATTADEAAYFENKYFGIEVEDRTTIPEGRVKLIPIEWEDGDPMFGDEEGTIWAEISEKWAKYAGAEDNGVEFYFISKSEFEAGQELEEGQDPAAFDPETFEIPADADWSTDIPTGINVDEYYVYARAAEGGTNFEGGEPYFIGTATIIPAAPAFAGKITVKDSYYVWNNEAAWKGLKEEIKPTLAATLAEGVNVSADDVTYYVQYGEKDENNDAADENGIVWDDDMIEFADEDLTFTYREGAYYRLVAAFNGNDNYEAVAAEDSKVFSNTFEIVRPKVTITTTVDFATIGVGTYFDYDALGYTVALPEGFTATELGFVDYPEVQEYDADYYWQQENGPKYWSNNELKFIAAGTYKVYVDEEEFGYNPDYCEEPEVKPATVMALAGDMTAAIEDQTLVFGDPLPLTLKYVDGYAQTETDLIEDFEEEVYADGTFVATLIKDAEGKDVAEEDAVTVRLYGVSYRTGRVTNWVTTILPVGTWKVSADFGEQNEDADFKMYVSSGTWTVTPRDITDSGIRGFGRSFNPHKTYTSLPIELEIDDFFGTEGRYRAYNQLPNGVRIDESEARMYGLIYGMLKPYFETEEEVVAPGTGEAQPAIDEPSMPIFDPAPKKEFADFEIVGYKDNIHAGTATVTIKGINNFTGERDLTFTIDKARLLVYPIEATWTIGTPEAYEYDVDGPGISIPFEDYDEEVDGPGRPVYAEDAVVEGDLEPDPLYVITYEGGIKTQLKHYFPGDKDLDVTTAKGFKDLVVLRDVRPNAGYYEWGLVADLPEDAEEADDYEFDFMYAPLTIEKGKIKVQVAAAEAAYQGTTKSDYTQDFELANADELVPAIAENWKSVVTIDYDAVAFTDNREKANDRYNAGSYTITAAPVEGKAWEDVFTAGNYEVTIVTPATATLTVKPRETTITAEDFDASYANFMTDDAFDPDKLAAAIAAFETAKDGNVTVPNAASVTIDPALAAGDKIQDVISKITVDQANKVVTVTLVDNANYAITVVEGEVTTEGEIAELILLSEMEDAVEYEVDAWGDPVLDKDGKPVVVEGSLVKGDKTKLTDYNGVAVRDISLTLKAPKLEKDGVENEAFAVWNKNEWHAMVLPFAVTAQDLSLAFGETYVIVNVVDVENTTEGDVKFMLPVEIDEEIPANTPFCVKVAQDFDFEEALEFHRADKFEPFTIVKPEAWTVSVDAGMGYTFEGNYEQEFLVSSETPAIRFLGPNKWYFVKSGSTTKYHMQPYTGYVNLGAAGSRDITFTFEEADGTTTSIKAVDFFNGNGSNANAEGWYSVTGMKMNAAPTVKGTYIQNGKKVLVK